MLCQYVFGQQDEWPEIHEDYSGRLFIDFIRSIEQDHPMKFFFREDWVADLKVEAYRPPLRLDKILVKTLEDKDLYFTSYTSGLVVLTRERLIRENIPDSYFNISSETGLKEVEEEAEEEKAAKTNGNSRSQVIYIGSPNLNGKGEMATLSGYVRERETGEPIVGAVVYVEDTETGVITDLSGYYVLTVPRGRHQIKYHSLGRTDVTRQVVLNSDGSLNMELSEKIARLRDVVVVAEKYQNVAGMQLGLERVDIKTIKQLPTSMGEADILKAVLLLPGVQTVGEAASGFNVRGGSTDQNLILINDAPIFNSSHFFGFFSVFNPDVIKEFELYKSGIPAEFGGRLSSIFDITTKNGNSKNFSGVGAISPVSGRLTLEGPIIKDKATFIVGGRSTYSDWLLKRIESKELDESDASFYDVNAKISFSLNEDNSFSASAYQSSDYFQLHSDTTYNYLNRNLTLSWKHMFSNQFYTELSGIYSYYSYNISAKADPARAFDLKYAIDHRQVKADFSYFPGHRHQINFGASGIWYDLDPGSQIPESSESIVASRILAKEKATESAIYLGDEFRISKTLSLYGGLRYSFYFFLGPQTVYHYDPQLPKSVNSVVDSSTYGKNELISSYSGPEWRFLLRYSLDDFSSLKLSYNRMNQYLHRLSNTTAISPTDTWKLSDSHIRPQVGDQVALGFYRDLWKRQVETSVEVYYKNIRDILEYKGGAELLLNQDIETDVINARGRVYGVELMIKKKRGRYNGWLSYTYSRSQVKTKAKFLEETINGGEWFPANYDKPHDFTIVGNYKFSRRFSISANMTYSTGRPITYPVAKYYFRSTVLLHYSDRNEYRIPDYFRLDLSLNLEGNLKSKKLAHSYWSLSVYNLTGRDNTYSIFFTSKNDLVRGYKLSVFNRPILTLSYSFKF